MSIHETTQTRRARSATHWFVLLLLVATAVFIVGVVVERAEANEHTDQSGTSR